MIVCERLLWKVKAHLTPGTTVIKKNTRTVKRQLPLTAGVKGIVSSFPLELEPSKNQTRSPKGYV